MRAQVPRFFLWLFAFFCVLNVACYWMAIFTAHPWVMRHEPVHYTLVQFPVGVLGAVFDTASFFVTIYIARRALRASSGASYVAHLSIDLVIAVIATWWVIFVFTVSGWLVSFVQFAPESLTERSAEYQGRVAEAVRDPGRSWRNIYFGVVMGASALLPTLTHIALSLLAVGKALGGRVRERFGS